MVDTDILSSEVVRTAEGRQYHIALAPGELANHVLLCGDPARAERAAHFLQSIVLERRNREFVTFTGLYKGTPVSIMSTGIGTDNTEIAMVESFHILEGEAPVFIRVGTCGSLQSDIALGDLVISTGAVRLENTSTFFVEEGYPAIAHYEVVLALITAAARLGYPFHTGLTASGSGFYGAQGRDLSELGIPVRFPQLHQDLARRNVLNLEMESSTLFTLCSLKGVRAGTVCTVYANRTRGSFIQHESKSEAEAQCVKTGLEAIKILEGMDAEKAERGRRYWCLFE